MLNVKRMTAALLVVSALVLTGCQGLATKPSDKFDDRSISFLVYGLKLHMQGEQRVEKSWMNEAVFIDRLLASYEAQYGKPLAEKHVPDTNKESVLFDVLNRFYATGSDGCDQFDANIEGDYLKVFMECSPGDGFIFYELLIDYQQGAPKLVDVKPLSSGVWFSEMIGAIVADESGLTGVKKTFELIGDMRAGKLKLADYYRINAYIKTNRMLALSVNSVNTDPNIAKEVNAALEILCPEDPFCAISVMDSYADTKEYEKIIAKLDIAKRHFPRSLNVNTLLGGLLLKTKQYERALSVGQDIIWSRPSTHKGYMLVLSASAMLQDEEQAVVATAALQKGFNLTREQMTNEYNEVLFAQPEFWQKVQAQSSDVK